MKHLILVVLFTIGFLFFQLSAAQNQGRQAEFQALYERWHKGMDAHKEMLSHPFFFQTEAGPPDLVSIVKEIKGNGLAMANFLCEKLANEKPGSEHLYPDVLLLEKVTGIDLFHAEDKPAIDQNFSQNIVTFTGRFREEWSQGVYNDPGAKIARLVEERLPKET